MCFAPEIDVATAVVAAGAGVDALRHVRRRSQLLLASIPLLLGAHQLAEALLWWQRRGQLPDAVGRGGLLVYLAFALVVLPALAPAALALVERGGRRRVLWGLTVLGGGVAVFFAFVLIRGPVSAEAADWHIDYSVASDASAFALPFYLVATCGALLASRLPVVASYGAANVVAVLAILALHAGGVISLWCFFAAAASVAIAVALRRQDQRRETGPAGAARTSEVADEMA